MRRKLQPGSTFASRWAMSDQSLYMRDPPVVPLPRVVTRNLFYLGGAAMWSLVSDHTEAHGAELVIDPEFVRALLAELTEFRIG